MVRRRRLRSGLGPEHGGCDGAEVSGGQPSSKMAVISLIMYRERMRLTAWLHQPSGRSGAQRFIGHWCNRWCNVSAGASWQKRQAPGVASDPEVEFDSGKRPPQDVYSTGYGGFAVTLDGALTKLGEVSEAFRRVFTVIDVTFEGTESLVRIPWRLGRGQIELVNWDVTTVPPRVARAVLPGLSSLRRMEVRGPA